MQKLPRKIGGRIFFGFTPPDPIIGHVCRYVFLSSARTHEILTLQLYSRFLITQSYIVQLLQFTICTRLVYILQSGGIHSPSKSLRFQYPVKSREPFLQHFRTCNPIGEYELDLRLPFRFVAIECVEHPSDEGISSSDGTRPSQLPVSSLDRLQLTQRRVNSILYEHLLSQKNPSFLHKWQRRCHPRYNIALICSPRYQSRFLVLGETEHRLW